MKSRVLDRRVGGYPVTTGRARTAPGSTVSGSTPSPGGWRQRPRPGRCGKGSGPALGIADTTRYHMAMAMTLRLSDEQTEALRRKAEAEHRSMQQVALAAIDAYVHQATPARRQSVPVTELMTMFQDLPPMSAEAFRADRDRYADAEAYFDAYERIHEPEDGE